MIEVDEVYKVANGLTVRHLNSYETDFLYHEIFEQGAYLQHGIKVGNDSIVFDVGANIGLFTLSLKKQFPGIQIYAFEPIPAAFECLAYNTARFNGSVRTSNVGISNIGGEAAFVYYPGYSVISGFHTDEKADAAVIKNGMKSGLAASGQSVNEYELDSLLAQRFREKIILQCRIKTISEVIRESGVICLDLLKIDAERSELAILNGISDEDWPKIRQIVLEAHDKHELAGISAILQSKGFDVKVEIEAALAESGIHNIYAIRR